jgi:hypothetical protein
MRPLHKTVLSSEARLYRIVLLFRTLVGYAGIMKQEKDMTEALERSISCFYTKMLHTSGAFII